MSISIYQILLWLNYFCLQRDFEHLRKIWHTGTFLFITSWPFYVISANKSGKRPKLSKKVQSQITTKLLWNLNEKINLYIKSFTKLKCITALLSLSKVNTKTYNLVYNLSNGKSNKIHLTNRFPSVWRDYISKDVLKSKSKDVLKSKWLNNYDE